MSTRTLTFPPSATAFTPKADATAPVKRERTRIYREYLTPALHRRFTSAAGLILAFCWFEAYLFSTANHLLWSWFPFGMAGVRALLLFIPCLAVLNVRVMNMHFGARETTSPAETLYAYFADVKSFMATIVTLGWYLFGAWFYGEVFIWSRSDKAGLGLVDPGEVYERPRVNENPIALRCLFLVLGVLQASAHMMRDYDRLHAPAEADKARPREEAPSSESPQNSPFTKALARVPRPIRELRAKSWTITNRAIQICVVGMVFGFNATYWAFLRRPAWGWAQWTSRLRFNDLPPNALPSGFTNAGTLLWQACYSSFLLVVLWEVSNAAFDIFAAQPPLRKGQALTSEIKDARGVTLHVSKDPNASLITGLKSKKEIPKAFAFWELYLICTQFDQRRRSIYTEVDGVDGSTWSQISKYALDEIMSVQVRVRNANEPAKPDVPKQQQGESALGKAEEPRGLPKIADKTVQDRADVFAKRKPDFTNTLGNLAKNIGSSPGAEPLGPRAMKALQWSTDQVLTKEQRQRVSPVHIEQGAGRAATNFLRSHLGEPFRRTFARSAKVVVFGRPYSSRANIVHATGALSSLVVHSLTEDQYGQVQKDIARIVRVYTDTIRAVEQFLQKLQPHWSDVYFTQRDREVAEVEEVLSVMKSALEAIMLRFGEYANGLGLSKKEVREAREAQQGSRRPAIEMAQVRAIG